MSWRLRWLIIAPVALFVMTTLLMSSCGGGGGCLGSYDEFGDFVPGLCPSPGPGTGFNLQTIVIAAGTPLPATPTPSPTTGPRHPTPTPTLEPQASPTAGIVGSQVDFHATGLFTKHNIPNPLKVIVTDITNSSSTVWSSSNPNVLGPPQPPPNGGIYQALSVGCSCADASSGGVSALPVSVAVVAAAGDPTPACPICPTPAITATATPHPAIGRAPSSAAFSQTASSNAPNAAFNGVLQWTFKGVSPIKSQLAASSDGNLYFVTLDGYLHELDSKGHERWRRRAAGSSIAVASDGTLYALLSDGSLEASSPNGKPLWTINPTSTNGPLAASSNAVYFQDNQQLVAATSSGTLQWSVPAPEEIATAAISDDGSIIAASNGGSVIAIASNGTHRWSFMPQGGFAGEIAIHNDAVYVGSNSGTLYALNLSNGSQFWHRETSSTISAGPVVDGAGSIVFGSDAIYSLTTAGDLAWSKTLPKDNATPLTSDGAGEVLAPIDTGEMAMLDSDGAARWSSASFGKVERAVLSPTGTLYIASEGKVYAVK